MPRVQQDELVHVDGAVAVHVGLQDEGVHRSLRLQSEFEDKPINHEKNQRLNFTNYIIFSPSSATLVSKILQIWLKNGP